MLWSSLVGAIESDRIRREQDPEIGDRGCMGTLQLDQSDKHAFSGAGDWTLPGRSAIIDFAMKEQVLRTCGGSTSLWLAASASASAIWRE
jgi:hypothetical protein